MSAAQDKKQRQMKLARLEIVAQLFKRGYSRRKIREEVKNRLDLKSYSPARFRVTFRHCWLNGVKTVSKTPMIWCSLNLNALTMRLESCGNSGRSQRQTTTRHNASRKALPPVTARRVRPQSRRIRQSERKQRLSALAMLLISPRYESSLKNAASSSACTPLKRKTSTPTAHLPPISLRAA